MDKLELTFTTQEKEDYLHRRGYQIIMVEKHRWKPRPFDDEKEVWCEPHAYKDGVKPEHIDRVFTREMKNKLLTPDFIFEKMMDNI